MTATPEMWDLGRFVTLSEGDERHQLEAWEEEDLNPVIALRTVSRSETGGLWLAGPSVFIGLEESHRFLRYMRMCRQNYYRRMQR